MRRHLLFLLLLAGCTGHGTEEAHEDYYSDWSAAIWLNASHGLVAEKDPLWLGGVRALHISGPAFGVGGKEVAGRPWSALVLDGELAYAHAAKELHRESVRDGEKARLMQAGDGSPPNAVAMIYKERTATAKKAEKKAPAKSLLGILQRDRAISTGLSRIFQVDLDSCIHGRNGNEVFMILQNHSMPPDNFHADICDDQMPGYTGLTIVSYPHDRWNPKWLGHFEMGAEDPQNSSHPDNSKGSLARLAPIPGRTVIFDGCVQHRATNPTAESTPLPPDEDLRIASALRRATGYGSRQRWWHWNARSELHGWRFTVTMQLRCRILGGNVSRQEDTETAAEQQPLFSVIRGGLTLEERERVQHVRKKALAAGARGEGRNFGTGDVDGHHTLFVHEHLDKEAPELRDRLLQVATEAASHANWDIRSHVVGGRTRGAKEVEGQILPLQARCFEYLTYTGKAAQQSIGWHADGSTIITMAVVMSNRSAYSGGALEFSEAARVERLEDLEAGDVAIWRGWTQHRVTPTLTGTREVFVVEWWIGADCATTLEPRAGDGVKDVLRALQLSPNSATVYRWLGETVCESIPCETDKSQKHAEAAYRKALELEPEDPFSMYALGNFLGGSRLVSEQLEAVDLLRKAHRMSPELISEPTVSGHLEAADHARGKIWKLGMCLLVVAPAAVWILFFLDKPPQEKKTASAAKQD